VSKSQGSAGNKARYESRYIVDMPTAGVIPKYTYSAIAVLSGNDGIMTEISASPFTNVNLGISFGGSYLLGANKAEWQRLPGFHLRVRLLDEKINLPAILLGFSSQGRGSYSNKSNTYQSISPGFFLAFSKNYYWILGNLALHGGINYTLEPEPESHIPNLYFGFEQSVANNLAVNMELNPNTISNKISNYTDKALFNTCIRWSVIPQFTVELHFRDILLNNGNNSPWRGIALEYINSF